jgi:hypothetical protein
LATITWEAYVGTPAWTSMGANRLVFSGSASSITATVAATTFQDGTHLGSGTPGTDQCGANHAPNVKILTSTTMSINGGGSQTLNDTNLTDILSSFRLRFNDAASFALQNGKLYTYDGSTTTNQAVGVDVAAYVKANSMSAWFTLNSDTTTGPSVASMTFTTANIGGDNTGERIALAARTAAVDHYYYTAISASPETAGGKSSFALGAYLEYY